jgi:hypothetical protein
MDINISKATNNEICSYIFTEIIKNLSFRNYNNHVYLLIENKWVYLSKSNKIFTFILVENRKINWNIGFSDKLATRIRCFIRGSEKCNFNKLFKKIVNFVQQKVINTAKDDTIIMKIPSDIIGNIFAFVPDDINGQIINKIADKILLNSDELKQQIIKHSPNIENNIKIVDICLKYVRLYALIEIIKGIRSSVCDEFHEKKSYEKKKYFYPILKKDDKIVKKYIYLKKRSYGYDSVDDQLRYTIENLIAQEAFKYDFSKPYPELDNFFYNKDNCFYGKLFKNDWKSEIPKLLSNSTNHLTKQDEYMLRQLPVWINYIFEIFTICTELPLDYIKKNMKRIKKILE